MQQKALEKKSNDTSTKGDQPTKAFSYDDLKMAWKKYAYKAKEQGLDTLFTAMTSRDPSLESDFKVEHLVDNQIQKSFVDQNLTGVVTFLRQELQNWSIDLTISVGGEDSQNKKLYSGKDKFNDMAERNPHLKTLQQRFKLDIDF